MKKYLKFLIAGLFLVISACGGGNNKTPTNSNSLSGNNSSNSGGTTSSSSTSSENIGETLSKIDNLIKSFVPEVVDSDITLPSSVPGYNIVITWASQNPEVISTTGEYSKPLDDTTVILTATYQYKDSGVHKVEMKPVVYGYSDEERVAIIKGELTKPEIDYNNRNITLVTKDTKFGITIDWEVTGSEYASVENNVLSVSEDAFLNGAEFTLTARYVSKEKEETSIFEYTIVADNNLRAEKVLASIVKPELIDNSILTVPVDGEYDATITWTANDEDVIIDGNTITLPAKPEQWTLLITGNVEVGDASKELSFDYQISADDGAIVNRLVGLIEDLPNFGDATLADKENIDSVKKQLDDLTPEQIAIFDALENAEQLRYSVDELLTKYIEIRNLVLTEEKATWDAIDIATAYNITFTDLNKTFTVATNEFVYGDYGIPTDSKYNVEIEVVTGDATGYIMMGDNVAIFGTTSNLPKVLTPVLTPNANNFTWTAGAYAGATTVRVYANGVLRREIPATAGSYEYRFNGITESLAGTDVEFVVQFVGNGTTHQSSEFVTFTANLVGTGQILGTPVLTVKDGVLTWTKSNYNQGYEVRIDDFRAYYTDYQVKIEDNNYSLDLSKLNLPVGTHTLKVKSMADNGGTPSPYSNEVTVTVSKDVIEGPTNIIYDNEVVVLSWDEIENAKYYTLEIPSLGYKTNLTTTNFDLATAELVNGEYEIVLSAFVVKNGANNKQAIVDYTNKSTITINVNLSETKLNAPTNIVADYNKVTWEPVENAVGYEVEINGKVYNATTNEFVFVDNGLGMNFDYEVRVKAIGATVADNSFYSEKATVKYNLTNIALLSNGATVTTDNETPGAEGMIDNNDGSGWQAATETGTADNYDSMSFVVELNNVYTIYSLHIKWEVANAAQYDIEVSENGETWTTVYEYRTEPEGVNRDDYLNLDTPINAKYVRFQGIQRGTQWGYRIFTFEVFTINQ